MTVVLVENSISECPELREIFYLVLRRVFFQRNGAVENDLIRTQDINLLPILRNI